MDTSTLSLETPMLQTGLDVRRECRAGRFVGPTAGLAPGCVQGNLAVLPQDWAMEFLRFCHANPKPCPLLGMSETGSPEMPALGEGLDIRTDLPRYRVWENGELVASPTEITSVWRDDLVCF